jgi:protein-arginine kinase activator protein McsA
MKFSVDGKQTDLAELDSKSKIPGLSRIVGGMLPSGEKKDACPHCGWHQKQWEVEGVVGCPLCYSSLEGTASAAAPADEKASAE